MATNGVLLKMGCDEKCCATRHCEPRGAVHSENAVWCGKLRHKKYCTDENCV